MEGWLEYMEQIDGGALLILLLDTQTNWHRQTFTAAETKGRMTTRACAQRSHQTIKRLMCRHSGRTRLQKEENLTSP